MRGGLAEEGFSDGPLLRREVASVVVVVAAPAVAADVVALAAGPAVDVAADAVAVHYEKVKDPSKILLLRCRMFHLHLELW